MADVRWNLLICILTVFFRYCYSQNSTICQVAGTCNECIEMGPNCAWCAQHEYGGVRCDDVMDMILTNCTDIQNPDARVINVTKDESLTDAGNTLLGEAVQVQPQEVRVQLRRGETATVEMFVRQASDYPVDMYYLMDLSESMSEDLVNLASLADTLVEEMKKLTSDFRVGFGSFVDKDVFPYALIDENGDVLLDCKPNCVYPYIFKNGLPLTNNTDLLKQTLDSTSSSKSKDAPEAGLEALLQVAVCGSQIGWREKARHLVIYASDAFFHSAGDGRLGGILTPNDGQCHVDPMGDYDTSKIMDYPSLGHLSAKIQDQDIIVLFVVTATVESHYKALTEHIPGSTTGRLAPDSGNIVSWITTLYDEITTEVQLAVLRVPDELVTEVTSHCEEGVSVPNSPSCKNLAKGATVSFSIDITAEACLSDGTTSFSISPVGFSEELTIFVDVICDCDCNENAIPDSRACNGSGSYVCGQCSCNPGMFGDTCQCKGDDSLTGDERAECIAPNSALVCSGRGQCICGECVCDKQKDPTHIVSGKYCQCDNFNCPLSDGKLCGGPSKGSCICDHKTQQSRCNCTQEYEGDSCNCLRSTENCQAQNGLICNAHGTCQCGACRCDANSPFKGQTCSECATCSGKCEVYQECVQCKAFNSGPLTDEQCSMCNLQIIKVKEFPDVDYPYNCSATHTDNCSIVFFPHFVNGMDENPVIYVLEETICPTIPPGPGVDARWVGIGIAIFIIVLGILFIILYKLYITRLDKKEYEEWLREKNNAQFQQNENPLYKAPSSLHANPAYGKGLFQEEEVHSLQEKS